MAAELTRDFGAKLAEAAQRYDDMATEMQTLAKAGTALNSEERTLLSIAFKNMIDQRRNAWRRLTAVETKVKKKASDDEGAASVYTQPVKPATAISMLGNYRKKIEDEVRAITDRVITLIDEILPAHEADVEARIFLLKMKGDYCRYAAEVSENAAESRKNAAERGQQAYQAAYDAAKEKLKGYSALRLGVALNFSVFFHDILDAPEKALTLAKDAFNEAINAAGETEGDDEFKESAPIVQLLRDNITLWDPEVGRDEPVA